MTRGVEFGEALELLFGEQLGRLKAIEPGRVTAWNRTTQVATIQPVTLGANSAPRAEIPGCVVVFPGAYWDVQLGSFGLLLVCDQDYHRWWRSGEDSVPATASSHSAGRNSVFIPGLVTSHGSRNLPANSLVLEKPVAGGYVRLGEPLAFKAAVHEELLSALDVFLIALDTWGQAVGVATGVAWGGIGAPSGPLIALRNGIAAGSYQSPSVYVED